MQNTATPSCLLPTEATSDTRDCSGKLRGLASAPKEVNTAIKCPSVSLPGFKEFQTCTLTHTDVHTNSCVTLAVNATNTSKTNKRRMKSLVDTGTFLPPKPFTWSHDNRAVM